MVHQRLVPLRMALHITAHPLAAAAGLANLDIMQREDLPARSAKVGAYFQRRLRESFSDHPLVGEDTRGGFGSGCRIRGR